MNPRRSRFAFCRDGFASQSPPAWLVDGILPDDGLGIVFGQSGSGKTFVALDLALSVAYGQRWHGHDTKADHGSVVYVAAEYTRKLRNRITAWRQEHGHKQLRNFIATKNPVQLHNHEEVTEFINALKAAREPGESISLIVFDTFARCYVGGDENSAKEIGLVVANADRIRAELQTAVVLVHHTLKDGNTFRGSEVLRDAPTTMIEVEAKAAGGKSLTVSCFKQKDDEEFKPLNLHLAKAFGSCVVRTGGRSELTMARVIQDNGGSCSWNEWSAGCERAGIPKGGSFDRLRRAMVETLKWVCRDGDRYTLTHAGKQALERVGEDEEAASPLLATAA